MYLTQELWQKYNELATTCRHMQYHLNEYCDALNPHRSLQKTMFRYARVALCRDLSQNIHSIQRRCLQVLQHALKNNNYDYQTMLDIIGSSYAELFSAVWDMERDIQRLNRHKDPDERLTGELYDCIHGMMQLLECPLLPYANQQHHEQHYLSRQYVCLLPSVSRTNQHDAGDHHWHKTLIPAGS